MNIFLKGVLVLTLLTATVYCYGQKAHPKDSLINSMEETAQTIMSKTNIPGMSVAVINKGEIAWVKSFGVSNLARSTKATEYTMFPAASLGKPVFAYAVMKLVDKKKLNLDSPLLSYVPLKYVEEHYLKAKLADSNFKIITARMLLSHNSGLPNWHNPDGAIKTMFTPGTKYSYSGEGYQLLQVVIEYITKQPVQQWMEVEVFKPLGMKNSTYNSKDVSNYTTTYGADRSEIPMQEDEKANVAYTFKTTAHDYAHFMIAIMDGKGLTTSTSQEMLRPQIATDICGQKSISWGLGFAVQPEGTDTVFFQWGKSPNSSGYAIGFKNSKKALIYLTNIAGTGLSIGEEMVYKSLNYKDILFSCFGVKPYTK